MSKGYWVVVYKSKPDDAVAKAYSERAVPAIKAFGGRLLTRGASQVQAYESGTKERAVIVEFDSFQKAIDARQSPAYQEALLALGTGVERDFRIVEGAES